MLLSVLIDLLTPTMAKKTRKLILDNEFKEYIYHSENTFESAVVLSCTTIIKKGKPSNDNKIRINNEFEIQQNKLDDGFWSFEKPEIMRLREKIEKQSIELQNIPNLKIYSGIKTGLNKAFMIDLNTRNKLIQQDFKNNEIIKPLLRGIDIQRWKMEYSDRYIILSKSGMELENSYLSLFDFMKNNEIKLKDRSDQGEFWYNLRDCAYYDKFEKEKIIWTEMTPKPSFLIDKEKYFLLNTSYMLIIDNENFNLNYVTALLNSNLLFLDIFKDEPKVIWAKVKIYSSICQKKLPIYPANPEKQQPLINATEKILNKNNELQKEINSFKHWIQKEFNVEKLSKKLNKYYELSKDEFIDELHKKKG
nr:TaqI-like C-terminal specificity domain-containing protein [Methanobacterium formicicum]